MATITERLEKLESTLKDTETLQDRIVALETQIKEFNDSMTAGEKQFEFLKDLPEKRGGEIHEKVSGIHDSLEQFDTALKEISDPFNEKIKDLTDRLKIMEHAVGISR